MHLGKSNIHKLRVLFDSGSSGSIIVAKFVKKLHVQNDTKTEWLTKGGASHTLSKCKILNEFTKVKSLNGFYMLIRLLVHINMI
jgi:hypothetical protein